MTKTFAELGVRDPLVKALTANGITSPFPIQVDSLPDSLAGRDVLGRGKTGSGKTLAFSIPMVARLAGDLAGGKRRPGRPLGLVLAPTRELATQITAAMEPLAAAYDLRITTIFGGVSQHRQVQALKAGVDIVVACPGRLEDLMKQKLVSLDAVEITVLDEADHMADLGFLPVVTKLLAATPQNGQRLLFSATLDNGVDKLVKRFLHNEVLHSVDDANSPVAAMTHHVFDVHGVDAKKALVQKLASGTGRRILFMRTKHQARKLARQLTEAGIPSVDLHGNLSQAARDRNLAAFSAGEARVLVATDVAARGVHVDDVELVVHVDPPAEHKAYLHRSGRTARAGSAGDVVTVVLPEQRKDLAILMRKAAIKVTPQQVTADSEPVNALVGEIAPHVIPTARPTTQPTNHGGGQRRSGGGRNGGGRAGGGRGGAQGGRGRAGQGGRGQGSGHASSQGSGRGQSGRTAAPRTSAPRTSAPRAAAPNGTGSGNGQRRRATRP
ncbi:DEAD/DEAH box helicase [Antrihabitans cavernicola]|uniref:DEAD/DEAH box helicase n=1 Tax=Antrihabitans cavernicola TaxID=2495913 RepID=A0A5A7SDB0_9NOCA|nr:DEAD/DEAH box helicase [Spelaeibacter cavernicola]KAA0024140.1 DEAD/DEAH box helicase [Spelaeibacter cavernicola]